MDQIIPILIHTKKTYDGSYFYVDYDVNVSAVISHQAAQTLIDDESNALKEKYRKKDACLGESYDNCFTRIRGPYDGQGIPMSREDVWCVLDIAEKYLGKKQWRRCTGLVTMLDAFLNDYYPGYPVFGVTWKECAERDIAEGHVFKYCSFLQSDIVNSWLWNNDQNRLRDAKRLLKMLYLYINPDDIEWLELPAKTDFLSVRGITDWIPVNEMLPDGDAVNPVTQDAYVYPVTVDFGDALDLRYYSFWKGHWYNQSPFPMEHLVTAWLPRPGVFEDGRDRDEIVHSVVVGSTSYWKIKDRNDPVDAVCNNCRYTIPLTEVVPENEEDTKEPKVKFCPRCHSRMELGNDILEKWLN